LREGSVAFQHKGAVGGCIISRQHGNAMAGLRSRGVRDAGAVQREAGQRNPRCIRQGKEEAHGVIPALSPREADLALSTQKPGGEAKLLLTGKAGFIGQLHAEGDALPQGDRLIDRRGSIFVGASLQPKEIPGKDGTGDGIAAAVAKDNAVALGGQYALPGAAIVHTNRFQVAAGNRAFPDGNGEVIATPGETRGMLGLKQ